MLIENRVRPELRLPLLHRDAYDLSQCRVPRQWKKLDGNDPADRRPEVFSSSRELREKSENEPKAQPYPQIGEMELELEWLRKGPGCSPEGSATMDSSRGKAFNRSTVPPGRGEPLHVYYGRRSESEENLTLMRLLDEQSRFTGLRTTEKLLRRGVRISMDGRGRLVDNPFVEGM